MMVFLKKSRFLQLAVLCLAFTACLAEEEDDEDGNEGLIPPNITQSGARGSWTHPEATPTVTLATEWYIETNRTTIASVCDFGDRIVKAVVQVSSRLSGSILTLQDSETKIIQDGALTCSISATNNTSYVLSLATSNQLNITNGGTTRAFTRIESIDEGEE